MTAANRLAARLDAEIEAAFEGAQLALLRRLVDAPSYTHDAADVEAAARIVDAAAADAGLVLAERVPDADGHFAAHRVYATPATGADDRALALVGHVDTVFPRSMGLGGFAHDPSDPDVVRGPGVLDMKSGLTAMLFATRALRRVAPELFARLRLRVVVNSDEEVGSPSSGPLFERLAPRTTAALVFEAGREGDRIITARKGLGTFHVTAHGRAAHAGNRHAEGANAIHGLSLVIPRIEALTDYSRGLTLNVGLISGGTSKNTVPAEARCVVDARFVRAEDADAVQRALEALCEAPFDGLTGVPERLHAVRISLSGGVKRPPMEPTPASQALRRRYERHAAACGLGTGEAPLQGGGSDANILAAAGVPCIDGLGPWGEHYHRPDEWCSVSSLSRRTRALGRLLAHEAECAFDPANPGS